MLNFIGQEIEVGHTVVYPATSGRSTQMVEAVVEGFTEKGVQLRPTGRTSRYTQHYASKTRYIDSRTGKGIDVSFKKHQERGYGKTSPDGKFLSSEEIWELERTLPYSERWKYLEGWTFTSPIYKDYVQEVDVTEVKLVTLTENATSIVRIN